MRFSWRLWKRGYSTLSWKCTKNRTGKLILFMQTNYCSPPNLPPRNPKAAFQTAVLRNSIFISFVLFVKYFWCVNNSAIYTSGIKKRIVLHVVYNFAVLFCCFILSADASTDPPSNQVLIFSFIHLQHVKRWLEFCEASNPVLCFTTGSARQLGSFVFIIWKFE